MHFHHKKKKKKSKKHKKHVCNHAAFCLPRRTWTAYLAFDTSQSQKAINLLGLCALPALPRLPVAVLDLLEAATALCFGPASGGNVISLASLI